MDQVIEVMARVVSMAIGALIFGFLLSAVMSTIRKL